MPKYKVTVNRTVTESADIEVDAADEDEATSIVLGMDITYTHAVDADIDLEVDLIEEESEHD